MKWVKKVGLVLGIIASVLVISNSVSGWVNTEKSDDVNTENQTQAVCVVDM